MSAKLKEVDRLKADFYALHLMYDDVADHQATEQMLGEQFDVDEKERIPIGTLAERVRHVVQSAFSGRRIVIFSGGEAKETGAILDEVRAIRDGGGFGSIIGRNSFQRPRDEAIKFLHTVMDIYAGKGQ